MTPEQTALVERRITAEELSVIRPLYEETYPVRPLLNELDALRAEVERLSEAHDKLVDRSVGAMAIAEGTQGYEKVPIDCPMLEAVSALRAEVAAFRKDAERYRKLATMLASDEEGDFCFDLRLHIGDYAPFETDADIKAALDAAVDNQGNP